MELKGTNFSLREWRIDDAILLQKHADNPNVSNFLMDAFPHPYTINDAVNWINRMKDQNPMLVFAIDIGGKLVGAVGLEMRHDIYSKAPLIGYWLGEAHWGKGYMTEAAKALIDAAHRTHQYETIAARALADNETSLHVLEKLGFHRLSKAKAKKQPRGAPLIVQLELVRPRWM